MRRGLLIGVMACVTGAGLWAQAARQQPSRDARVTSGIRGEIAGLIVTDEETPQPVRRGLVRALASGGDPRSVYTDATGRFVFPDLPLGSYTIEASKPGFVRTAFGARRHDRPGTPVNLTDALRSQNLQMRMPRGGVITGRIVDEYGQPASGTNVRAQLVRTVNGERTLSNVPMAGALFGESTDDRGVYRLYGLPAGDYVISATPRYSAWGDIRRMTETDISAAQQAMKQPAATDAATDPPITMGYTAVFYPGALTAAQAGVITLKTGEERSGVDVSVQFVRTASIEGVVLGPGSVRLEAVELLMMPRLSSSGSAMIVNISSANRRVAPDGKFSYTGITSGAYTISARVNQEGTPPLWASADVDIDGQPVSGVTLGLQEGMNIVGQMVFDADGVDPPTLFTRARLNLIPAEGNVMVGMGANSTQISASGGVSIKGVPPGRYRVNATFNTPEANWILKSAVIKGKDALDTALELAAGDTITDAVFTFTNRTQALTGTLQDASKRPAPDYTVVLFPADRALWGSTRRVRSTRPGTGGKFAFANLPAGAYRIAAVTDIGAEELRDPALLEELAAASIAFTIADGEKKVQDLRIASGG
ncbi:MAG: carboxypeptidase regulatory-like domain-containing protein [Acidobacteria bacterium]|nr:carboxypeptidase regulatory-like domain-containing protein [Acidobacteriota bacterium]